MNRLIYLGTVVVQALVSLLVLPLLTHHLTKAEFTRVYWHGVSAESDWKPGSSWHLKFEDGRIADTGEIIEGADAVRAAFCPRGRDTRRSARAAAPDRAVAGISRDGKQRNRLGWARRTGTLLRWDQGLESGLLQRRVGRT